MRTIFADTVYWIALANPRDEWHSAASHAGAMLGPCRLLTTDEVLVEFLTFFSKFGEEPRTTAVQLVHKIANSEQVTVLPQTRDSFLRGLRLYEQRPDKEYSLTDCISMETMREQNLHEVLTHDHHFAQEGFEILLKDKDA